MPVPVNEKSWIVYSARDQTSGRPELRSRRWPIRRSKNRDPPSGRSAREHTAAAMSANGSATARTCSRQLPAAMQACQQRRGEANQPTPRLVSGRRAKRQSQPGQGQQSQPPPPLTATRQRAAPRARGRRSTRHPASRFGLMPLSESKFGQAQPSVAGGSRTCPIAGELNGAIRARPQPRSQPSAKTASPQRKLWRSCTEKAMAR